MAAQTLQAQLPTVMDAKRLTALKDFSLSNKGRFEPSVDPRDAKAKRSTRAPGAASSNGAAQVDISKIQERISLACEAGWADALFIVAPLRALIIG